MDLNFNQANSQIDLTASFFCDISYKAISYIQALGFNFDINIQLIPKIADNLISVKANTLQLKNVTVKK